MRVAWNDMFYELVILPFQWKLHWDIWHGLLKWILDGFVNEKGDGLSKEIWDGLLKEIWDGLLKEIRSKPCSSVSFPFCQAQSFQEKIASNKNESGLCPSPGKTIKQIYLHATAS